MKKAMFLVLVAVLVFAIAAPAFALSGSVTVPMSATILAKIEVSTPTSSLAFGSLAPDETKALGLTVTVKSNKAYSGDTAVVADASGNNYLPKLVQIKGGHFTGVSMGTSGNVVGSHFMAFSLTAPWDVAPDTYTANAVITVDQL